MDHITLEANSREAGKKQTKAVRQAGNVPCVLYADGVDPVLFDVPQLSLRPLIYTNETHRVRVEVGDGAWDCILKEVDYHPVTDEPLHADFQVLVEGRPIKITVPLRFTGVPLGVQAGGNATYILNEVEVICLPQHMPSFIEVPIGALKIGDSVHVEDLGVEGVEFLHPGRQTVVTVVGGRLVIEGEEEEEEGLEGEEAAEGEEGAEATAEAEEEAEG